MALAIAGERQLAIPDQFGSKAVQIAHFDDTTGKLVIEAEVVHGIIRASNALFKPVVVIPIVGLTGTGKSFFLNLLVDYIKKRDILGPGNFDLAGVLRGMLWKPNEEATTRGLWMWEKALPLVTDDGLEVSVLLLDSQGLSDSDKSASENVDILILLAAFQMADITLYNLEHKLDINDVKLVELCQQFIELSEGGGFGPLVFVIRDWKARNKVLGYHTGYLKGKIEDPSTSPKAKERYSYVEKAFDFVDACLLPFPGEDVDKAENEVNMNEVKGPFLTVAADFFEKALFKEDRLVRGPERFGINLSREIEILSEKFDVMEVSSEMKINDILIKQIVNDAIIDAINAMEKTVESQQRGSSKSFPELWKAAIPEGREVFKAKTLKLKPVVGMTYSDHENKLEACLENVMTHQLRILKDHCAVEHLLDEHLRRVTEQAEGKGSEWWEQPALKEQYRLWLVARNESIEKFHLLADELDSVKWTANPKKIALTTVGLVGGLLAAASIAVPPVGAAAALGTGGLGLATISNFSNMIMLVHEALVEHVKKSEAAKDFSGEKEMQLRLKEMAIHECRKLLDKNEAELSQRISKIRAVSKKNEEDKQLFARGLQKEVRTARKTHGDGMYQGQSFLGSVAAYMSTAAAVPLKTLQDVGEQAVETFGGLAFGVGASVGGAVIDAFMLGHYITDAGTPSSSGDGIRDLIEKLKEDRDEMAKIFRNNNH